MAKKINNTVSALGFKIGKSAPIDDRTQFLTTRELIDYTFTGGLVSLYDGIEVFVEETKLKYKWVETDYGLLNAYNGRTDAEQRASFEYPEYAVGGVIYTGREFNWVISSQVITYQLTVTSNVSIGEHPTANPTGIQIRYNSLPEHVLNSGMADATIRVLGATEIDFPGEIIWDLNNKYITLYCSPMYPINEELIIKLL